MSVVLQHTTNPHRAMLALLCSVLLAMQSSTVHADNSTEQKLLTDNCNSWQLKACAITGQHPRLYDSTVLPQDFYQQPIESEAYYEGAQPRRLTSMSFKSSRQYLLGGLKKRVKNLRALTSPLNDDEKGRRVYMDLESDGAALTFQINY